MEEDDLIGVASTTDTSNSHHSKDSISPAKNNPSAVQRERTQRGTRRRLDFSLSGFEDARMTDGADSISESDDASACSEGSALLSFIQNDTDDEEEDSREEDWQFEEVPCVIRLTMKCGEQMRLEATRLEKDAVLTCIKQRNGLREKDCIPKKVIAAFFIAVFIELVHKYVEEMRVSHQIKVRPFGIEDVCNFFKVVLASMVYHTAPKNLFGRGVHIYGLMKTVDIDRGRFGSIWNLLQMRRPLPISLQMDTFLERLEGHVREVCSVCFVREHACTLALDDDKLPFTRKGAKELGIKAFKIKDKWGAVQHCLVSVNSRLFLGGYLHRLRDSTKDCVNHLLGGITGARTNPLEALPPTVRITLDRGYSHVVLDKNTKLCTLTTVKRQRSSTFPFTFSLNKKSSDVPKGVRKISCDGEQAIYFATRKQDGMLAAAWRDQGRVTLLQSTGPTIVPEDWEYAEIQGSLDAFLQLQGSAAYKHFMKHRRIITVKQRTTDWFLAHRFNMTSSTMLPVVRLWTGGFAYLYTLHFHDPSRVHANVDLAKLRQISQLLLDCSCIESMREVKREFLDSNKTVLELKTMIEERQLTGVRSKWRKPEIITFLLEQLNDCDSVFVPLRDMKKLEQLLLDSWYFKNAPDIPHLSLGQRNEISVRNKIEEFVNSHKEDNRWSIADVQEVGLAQAVDVTHASSSLDGIVLLTDGTKTAVGGLEIKTRVEQDTVAAILRTKELGCPTGYREVRIGLHNTDRALFQLLVPNAQVRLQLLHHAAVLRLDCILYVESTTSSITYAVLIDFAQTVKSAYLNTIIFPLESVMKRMLDEVANPESDLFSRLDISRIGDRYTMQQHYRLHVALSHLRITSPNGVLPAAKYIRPKIVSDWNNYKGGTDVHSRVMSHIRPRLHGSLQGLLMLRFFAQLVANAERVSKLTDMHHYESLDSVQKLWRALNVESVQAYLIDTFETMSILFRQSISVSPPSHFPRTDVGLRNSQSHHEGGSLASASRCSKRQRASQEDIPDTTESRSVRISHTPVEANSPSHGVIAMGFGTPTRGQKRMRGRCRVCCLKCMHEGPIKIHNRDARTPQVYCLACTEQSTDKKPVYLCDEIQPPLVRSCFELYHSGDALPPHPFVINQ